MAFQDGSDEPMKTINQHLSEVYDGQLTLILSLFYPCSCSVPLWDLQGLSTYCLKPLQTSFLSQNSVQMYAVTHSSLLILYVVLYVRLTTFTKPPEHPGASLEFSLFSSQAPSTHGPSHPSSAVSSTVLTDHLVLLGSALPHQPPCFPAILDHVTLLIVSPSLWVLI